MKKCIT